MRLRIKQPEKTARYATIATLCVMVVWGLVSVALECRPFWVDEWRIVYNLKFKTVNEIWGKLAFMQQFPRVYLSGLKYFTRAFDYNYFSLRLPSYIIALLAIVSVYRLANRLYPAESYNRFLMVMMLVSCGTFTEYFVQTKQYSMDLFLCVVALCQLVYLLQMGNDKKVDVVGYLVLCAGLLVCPFFSYTYPIAIAPVYLVVLVQNIGLWRTTGEIKERIIGVLRQWFPLFLCTFSITVFYVVDVAQLTADKDMSGYWSHLMMGKGFDWQALLLHIFHLFAEVGAGLIFWWLFGLLGSVAFIYGLYTCWRTVFATKTAVHSLVVLYSALLLCLVIALGAAGKIPLGEPRLNAFCIPAISVLIILLLEAMMERANTKVVSRVLSFVLLAGLIGNIYSTVAASFLDDKYARRMNIYRSTQAAIKEANIKRLPILVTDKVAYPYDNTPNLPLGNTVPGDWVLMTFPAYKVNESMPVYAIADTGRVDEYLKQLPVGITAVMVGDGINYRIAKVSN